MDTLTWREVDFGSVVLAGVAGGYLMALVGLWAGRVPGLVAIDIADHGRKYMVSDRSSAFIRVRAAEPERASFVSSRRMSARRHRSA